MATDILIHIERFTPQKGWKFIGGDEDILGQFLKRNYTLYGILANEESDYEFIGDNETRGLIPIVPPRGIPANCDKEKSYSNTGYSKGSSNHWHSSWVTLREIIDYPHWDTLICYEIEVKIGYYKKEFLSNTNHSIIEARDSRGQKIDNQQFREILDSTNENSEIGYTTVKILLKERYKDKCKEFLNDLIPKLKELGNDYSKIRLIYEFW